MSEVWRHLVFDFRRYGWLALAALAFVSVAPYWGQGLLAVAVVPLMMMNHKAVGSRAWWLVRPLNRTRLWLAKVIGILAMCVAAIGVMSIKPVILGIHPVFVAWCQLEWLPPLVAACAVTAMLAVFSENLRRYFLSLPAVLIVAACLGALWVQLTTFMVERNPGEPILSWFPTEPTEFEAWILIAVVSAAGLFIALWAFFRKRRLGRAIALAVIAILLPLYFGNIVSMAPLYITVLKLQGKPVTYEEFRPIAGHIAIQETKVLAEERGSSGGRVFGWQVRIPLELHLDESLEPDQLLETYPRLSFSAVDVPNPLEGRATHNPNRQRGFNHRPALLHAAAVEAVNSADSGREMETFFDLPGGAQVEDWTGRPMALSMPLKAYGDIKRAHFVGALEFKEGSTLIDRGDLHRIFRTRTRDGETGFALTGETLLEPRTFFNPAKQWDGGDGRVNFVLWDPRNAEAHFAERGIRVEKLKNGGFRFESGFPVLHDRKFPAEHFAELKLLVIREVSVKRVSIPIEPATFTIRLLEESGDR